MKDKDWYEIKKGVHWVGAVDWNVRGFHGHTTEYGTTYNSYLVTGERIALIDAVKSQFAGELIANIKKYADPSKIDYVVVNHIEPDHSGALPEIMKLCPNATIVVTAMGKAGLAKYYDDAGRYNYLTVKEGDTLSLGGKTLAFVPVPMLHWPDSMVAYLSEDKILFSNDAFGQHFAFSRLLDTENDLGLVYKQAAKYYANIVLPFGMQTMKALDAASNLATDFIAPSHGLVWSRHIRDIIEKYTRWGGNETKRQAVIVYDTMWRSTESLAKAAAEGFKRRGIPVRLADIKTRNISDLLLDILESEYVGVGSPTMNNQVMPEIASFLNYLKGLSPKKRKGFAFGSYGWSGQSVGIIENALSEIGFEIIAPSARHQFAPGAEVLEKYAAEVAAALPECEAESGKAAANAAGCIGYGLYILSANENGKDFACVTNTLLQVTSSEPLKFVATVSKRNHTHGIIERTGKFNISTLTEDVPFELIKRFGFQSGRDADKFDGFDEFKRSRNGLAYVAGNANAYMSFEVADSADFGTHTLFTATLTESAVLNDRESVTYAYYQKNIKPKPILGQNKKVGFRCGVCGYEYEGETLPEDFICPLCKHGAGDFVKI